MVDITPPNASTSEGASSVEVYGFVGWITSAVAYVIFLLWAYIPESVMQSLGLSYYPAKYWALAIPTWCAFLVLYIYWSYESFNMMHVPPLSSLYTIADEKSKWAENVGLESVVRSTDISIPPLIHIPAPIVTRVLYGRQTVQEAEAEERAWQRRGSVETQPSPPPSPGMHHLVSGSKLKRLSGRGRKAEQ